MDLRRGGGQLALLFLACILGTTNSSVGRYTRQGWFTTHPYESDPPEVPLLGEQRFHEGLEALLAQDGAAITQQIAMHKHVPHHTLSPKPRTLLAVTTSNVWERTFGLLMSLANVPDQYDLLVVDECSTDGTRDQLAKLARMNIIQVNHTSGVTHQWNLAYQYFVDHEEYDYLMYANNDVLIPPGAITKLVASLEGSECDLVSPLSTVNGKGHVGMTEGLESVFNLSIPAARVVEDPFNYVRVQQALDQIWSYGDNPVIQRGSEPFNGFFFALPRRITRAAADERHLFGHDGAQFGQESDLALRMDREGMKRCLHLGVHVFHYKASTIPQGNINTRKEFRAACDMFQEQQQQQEQIEGQQPAPQAEQEHH